MLDDAHACFGDGLFGVAFGVCLGCLGNSIEEVKQMSLKWAMIIAVIMMTPLSILWHIGAMKLPKGDLDDEGDAIAREGLGGPVGALEHHRGACGAWGITAFEFDHAVTAWRDIAFHSA